jgi:hypothetical protein
VDWTHLNMCLENLSVFVKRVMSTKFPQNVGNFCSTWRIITLSNKASLFVIFLFQGGEIFNYVGNHSISDPFDRVQHRSTFSCLPSQGYTWHWKADR